MNFKKLQFMGATSRIVVKFQLQSSGTCLFRCDFYAFIGKREFDKSKT